MLAGSGRPAPRLSVVVGTFNRREMLERCLSSIFAQTETPVRVYVTDSGSTDGTVEYLEGMASDRLVPIFQGRKLGQARAYNDVFRTVETPHVAWLSDDNEIVNHGLDVAVEILDRRRQTGMVALKVKDVTGPFVDAPYIGAVSAAGILNVNQGVLRTEVLRAVGGFSEAFRDYGIDPDLTAKVFLSGHEIVYTRKIAIHHHRGWSSDRESPEYQEILAKNRRAWDLYEKKYACLLDGRGRFWKLKRWVWARLRRLDERRPGRADRRPGRSWLGLNRRDLMNILNGRYISLLDPIRCAGRSYHLVQRCPPRRRLASLPPDPPVPED